MTKESFRNFAIYDPGLEDRGPMLAEHRADLTRVACLTPPNGKHSAPLPKAEATSTSSSAPGQTSPRFCPSGVADSATYLLSCSAVPIGCALV